MPTIFSLCSIIALACMYTTRSFIFGGDQVGYRKRQARVPQIFQQHSCPLGSKARINQHHPRPRSRAPPQPNRGGQNPGILFTKVTLYARAWWGGVRWTHDANAIFQDGARRHAASKKQNTHSQTEDEWHKTTSAGCSRSPS